MVFLHQRIIIPIFYRHCKVIPLRFGYFAGFFGVCCIICFRNGFCDQIFSIGIFHNAVQVGRRDVTAACQRVLFCHRLCIVIERNHTVRTEFAGCAHQRHDTGVLYRYGAGLVSRQGHLQHALNYGFRLVLTRDEIAERVDAKGTVSVFRLNPVRLFADVRMRADNECRAVFCQKFSEIFLFLVGRLVIFLTPMHDDDNRIAFFFTAASSFFIVSLSIRETRSGLLSGKCAPLRP